MPKFLGELLTLNLYNVVLFREKNEEAVFNRVKYSVTTCAVCFTFYSVRFYLHSAFLCFTLLSEQTAGISLNNILPFGLCSDKEMCFL